MGLYGSPDVGNLYTEEKIKEEKKRRNIVIGTQTLMLAVLYILMMWVAEDRFEMTISYVGVFSIVYFVVFYIEMIINLFKKRSVRKEIRKMLICMLLITICLILS